MGTGITKVTRELVLRVALFGACRLPKLDKPVSEHDQGELFWAEKILTDKEKRDLGRPLWTLSGSGSGDGYGSGSGDGYGSGDCYGSGSGDGSGDGSGYGSSYCDGYGYGDGYGSGSGSGSGDGDGDGGNITKALEIYCGE